jgi:hypothetical protein
MSAINLPRLIKVRSSTSDVSLSFNTKSKQFDGLVTVVGMGNWGGSVNGATYQSIKSLGPKIVRFDTVANRDYSQATTIFGNYGIYFNGNSGQGAVIVWDGPPNVGRPPGDWLRFSGSYTISAWVVINTAPGVAGGVISRCNSDNSHTNYSLDLLASSGTKLRGFHITGGVNKSTVGTTSLSTRIPYHLTVRYDGSNIDVFVNGVRDNNSPTAAAAPDNTYITNIPITSKGGVYNLIGANGYNVSTSVLTFPLNGIVWDVRFYDKALPDNIIRQMYEPNTRMDLYNACYNKVLISLPAPDPVNNSCQILWNCLKNVSNSNEIKWNDLSLVNNSRQFPWNVLKVVNNNSQFLWNLFGLVGNSGEFPWNNLNTVTNNNQLIWNCLNLSSTNNIFFAMVTG